MNVSLVVTVVAADRPGVIDAVAQAALQHGANWESSRMARMAGRFAGILLVSVPEEAADALEASLGELKEQGIRVLIDRSDVGETPPGWQTLNLDLMGHDRSGLLSRVSRLLAERGVTVDELTTEVSSAPMTGEPLFRMSALLRSPPELPGGALRELLEALAGDLMVELKLLDG